MKNINWGFIGIMGMTMGVWYSIFTNGFFITVIGLVIGSCMAGIIIKLREDTRV